MELNNISVIGSGTMGNGIAHVSALSGYNVSLIDSSPSALDKALETINNNLSRQLSKGIISDSDAKEALGNISISSDISQSSQSDLVIEAVPEDFGLKLNILKQIDSVVGIDTIIATNTSSISITKLAEGTKRSDKVIGMHFMNPVPVMKLVEIIASDHTSDRTHEIVVGVAKSMGKIPVSCKDFPGFVSNRILMPMINEAIICYEQGVASADSIDEIMVLGMSHPMGPLRLADLIGLDICLNIMNVLYDGFNDKKYKPSKLLSDMVSSGTLGKKTGEGFYRY